MKELLDAYLVLKDLSAACRQKLDSWLKSAGDAIEKALGNDEPPNDPPAFT